MKQGKLIIVSAPSGSGKSTIINAVMGRGNVGMRFSVSATNRPPREGEADGVHYHFLSTDDFRRRVEAGDFVEWEEVYPGRFYGTLRSEIERILDGGQNCVLDIDVRGAVNVKRMYGSRALSLFIMPPGVDELRRRLEARATDGAADIDRRVAKAAEEMGYAPRFDVTVVNDNLEEAVERVESVIIEFLGRP